MVQQDRLTIDCQESGIRLFFVDVSDPDNPDLKRSLLFDEGQFPSTQSLAMSLPYVYVTFTITSTDSASGISGSTEIKVTDATAVAQTRPVFSYRLGQNYPNPFNPVTTIEYSVQHATLVDLELYDITGRSVRKLIYKHQKPGVYQVTFDAKALPSGIYFYRIRMGEFSAVKKMVLIE